MVCRLCFVESDDCIEIFSEEKIPRYIKKFLDLEISEDDTVSKLICGTCWQKIKDFQYFYMQIKEAQRRPLVKMKKENCVVEKEFAEMDDSAFEYVTTEIDDHDLNETTEITATYEGEEITPDNYNNIKNTIDDLPNHLKKKSRHSKTLSKTTRSFKNEAERKFFVELMKREEVIWNRTHTLHSSSRALSEAWKRISLSMPNQKSVHECKVMWKSLRDALRYERRKAASGCDQAHDLRNLLYFVSATNGQKRPNNLPSSRKTPQSIAESSSKSTGKCRSETKKIYKIQNYHLFDNTTAQWSDRTCENSASDMSAYSEGPTKHYSNNISFEAAAADRPHSTSGVFTISTAPPSTNMESLNEPPPVDYKTTSNAFYGQVKSEFKDEVSDLVGSISKALNRLVTIATTQVQTKSNSHDFKYEYIWKLIECLYAQMDQTIINDLNQRIINMVYEGCKINVY